MNSQAYQHALRSHLLPNSEFLTRENLKFQEDNQPVHASNSSKYLFLVNNVETLKWPAKSFYAASLAHLIASHKPY